VAAAFHTTDECNLDNFYTSVQSYKSVLSDSIQGMVTRFHLSSGYALITSPIRMCRSFNSAVLPEATKYTHNVSIPFLKLALSAGTHQWTSKLQVKRGQTFDLQLGLNLSTWFPGPATLSMTRQSLNSFYEFGLLFFYLIFKGW
jgi:hypothetical protein